MLDDFAKLSYILGNRKKKLFFILILFLIVSLVDAFAISLLSPFVVFATNPEALKENPVVATFLERWHVTNDATFILIFGSIVASIFLLQLLAYIYCQRMMLDFVYNERRAAIDALMEVYIYAPYVFHLKKNSASIINHILSETRNYGELIGGLMWGFTNGILVLILLGLLTATDYSFLFLISLAFLPTVLIYVLFLGNRMKIWGQEIAVSSAALVREINHAMGGLKDTKVIGSEAYFLNKIDTYASREARYTSLYSIAQVVPATIIKTSLIILVVGIVCIFSFQDHSRLLSFSGTVTVFAVAALRLIPATNLIIHAYGQLKSCGFSVNIIYQDLQEVRNFHRQLQADKGIYSLSAPNQSHPQQPQLEFNHSLSLNHIYFRYPTADVDAIKDVSLTIRKGEAIAFIGRSGSGKTTLVDIILGLLFVDGGSIDVDGQSVYGHLRSWQNLLGYIPQSIFLTDETLEQNIAFGVPAGQIDAVRLERILRQAQLEDLVASLPQGVKTEVGERGVRLSGGQRQRVGIARALYHEREILVLDEATSALDNETEKLVNEAIQSLSGNKTMIIIAHRLSTVQHCHRLYLLEQGQVIATGPFAEIVDLYQSLNAQAEISAPHSRM